MKISLTNEQSKHLIDLGVQKEKAYAFDYIDSGKSIGGVELPPIQAPVFTLTDFLEIIPKEIGKPGAPEDVGNLVIYWFDNGWNVAYAMVVNYYAEELIDALYSLACWYYGEYLKSEKR